MLLQYGLANLETNKEFNLDQYEVINILGYIPGWLGNIEFKDMTAKEALKEQYNFGLFEMKGGEVTEDGTFKYPGDPDLKWIAKITRKDETIYQYYYGIIAIIDKDGNTFVTRMD